MTATADAAPGAQERRAVGLMCLGVMLLVMNDVGMQWLVERYSPFQILFLRGALALPFIALVLVLKHGRGALISRSPRVHLLRGVLALCASFSFVLSLRYLALTEATALIFAAPIIVVALSVLLGDRVGPRRWAAVVVGFIGVLIIVRPGGAAFQAASLLAVAAAFFHAGVMISARWIDKEERFLTLLLYMTAAPALLASFALFLEWPEPQPVDFLVFPFIAFLGPVALAIMSQAFRVGTSSVVAPFDYTALMWATLFDWLLWGVVPDIWVYAGAAVIMGSGIFLIFRDKARSEVTEERP